MIYDLLAGNAKIKIKEREGLWCDRSIKVWRNTISFIAQKCFILQVDEPTMNSISNRELVSSEYNFKGVQYKDNIKID